MGYEPAYLSKQLCEMYRDSIKCLYHLDEPERLRKYLFTLSEACYVSYNSENNYFFNATYLFYDRENVTIELDGMEQGVRGYLNGELIYRADLPGYINEYVDELAGEYWAEMREKKTFTVIESASDGYEIVNVLE
jgi:hypothetical protein